MHITDNDRTFGTVTILPGGQIWVGTSAQVMIDKRIKASTQEQAR